MNQMSGDWMDITLRAACAKEIIECTKDTAIASTSRNPWWREISGCHSSCSRRFQPRELPLGAQRNADRDLRVVGYDGLPDRQPSIRQCEVRAFLQRKL